MRAFVRRFIRFGLVGTTGFLIDFSLTWLCRDVLGVFEYVANCVGFTFGATSNYILNRRWTWRSQNPNIKAEFITFFAVSLCGLAINSLVIFLCMESWPVNLTLEIGGYEISAFWLAKLVATAVVMVWNFVVNNFFTFRKSKR